MSLYKFHPTLDARGISTIPAQYPLIGKCSAIAGRVGAGDPVGVAGGGIRSSYSAQLLTRTGAEPPAAPTL
jgi:hypothetical protein